jgi:aldose sugar dehydrogenase
VKITKWNDYLSSINIYVYLSFVLIAILLINSNFVYETRAPVPKPGTLPLLKDKSVKISDPELVIEKIATGLKQPTAMAFLDSRDILVLEKDNGTVRKIVNGNLVKEPLLDINVATFDTRGMLGIAVAKNETLAKLYVFLYYTEAKQGQGDGEDKCDSPSKCNAGNLPNGNRLYRYELSPGDQKLINRKVIFSWPGLTRADHNGGKLIVGPDKALYLTVGDGYNSSHYRIINNKKGLNNSGMAGILVLNHNGGPIVSNHLIGHHDPLSGYYAYGIRNSFGIDFDPVTGNLWDTENGPVYGDEINLVKPGFNSGWRKVQGLSELRPSSNIDKLENFAGKGNYSEPEFEWNHTVGPTAIKFLNSDKYGAKYKNDIFVGDINYGNLYRFDLVPNRAALDLQGPLIDKVADNYEELASVIFGTNLGGVSDIEVGPDGFLYIVSYTRGEIFKIIPKHSSN